MKVEIIKNRTEPTDAEVKKTLLIAEAGARGFVGIVRSWRFSFDPTEVGSRYHGSKNSEIDPNYFDYEEELDTLSYMVGTIYSRGTWFHELETKN